jgi:uncharacterized protein YbaP (TraB family)
MIWKFDNSNTYLFGSIHALRVAEHCFSNQIDYLYSQSSQIFFEANLDKIPMSLLTYDDGGKLSDNISNKLFLQTQKIWAKHKLPANDLEKTKPWQVANIVMVKLLEKRGFLFANGVDKQLFAKAKADNKDIIFLEPENLALLCLDNATHDEQEGFLSSVINNPDVCMREFFKLLKSWSDSDINALSLILQKSLKFYPSMFQCLVIDRNKAWLRAIVTSIETNMPSLFAVGALHCVDVCSVQSLIREIHGYTSTALK